MPSYAHDITKMQNKRLLFELMSLTAHITRATETGGHEGTVARLKLKRKRVVGEILKRLAD